MLIYSYQQHINIAAKFALNSVIWNSELFGVEIVNCMKSKLSVVDIILKKAHNHTATTTQ